jgi:hypothetical protein
VAFFKPLGIEVLIFPLPLLFDDLCLLPVGKPEAALCPFGIWICFWLKNMVYFFLLVDRDRLPVRTLLGVSCAHLRQSQEPASPLACFAKQAFIWR